MNVPRKTNKSSVQIVIAAIKSAFFVTALYFFSQYIQEDNLAQQMITLYLLFWVYFTWHPKFIRFLRRKVSANEFRDINSKNHEQ